MPNASPGGAPRWPPEHRPSATAAPPITGAVPAAGAMPSPILIALQAQYAAWLDALPDNLRDGATAEALQAICDLDLADIKAVEPPRGFGRD